MEGCLFAWMDVNLGWIGTYLDGWMSVQVSE